MLLVAKDELWVTPNSEEHLPIRHICPVRFSCKVEQPSWRRRRVVQVSAPLKVIVRRNSWNDWHLLRVKGGGVDSYETQARLVKRSIPTRVVHLRYLSLQKSPSFKKTKKSSTRLLLRLLRFSAVSSHEVNILQQDLRKHQQATKFRRQQVCAQARRSPFEGESACHGPAGNRRRRWRDGWMNNARGNKRRTKGVEQRPFKTNSFSSSKGQANASTSEAGGLSRSEVLSGLERCQGFLGGAAYRVVCPLLVLKRTRVLSVEMYGRGGLRVDVHCLILRTSHHPLLQREKQTSAARKNWTSSTRAEFAPPASPYWMSQHGEEIAVPPDLLQRVPKTNERWEARWGLTALVHRHIEKRQEKEPSCLVDTSRLRQATQQTGATVRHTARYPWTYLSSSPYPMMMLELWRASRHWSSAVVLEPEMQRPARKREKLDNKAAGPTFFARTQPYVLVLTIWRCTRALKPLGEIRADTSPSKSGRLRGSPDTTLASFHRNVHTWWSVLPFSACLHQLLFNASPSTLHHMIKDRAVPRSRVSLGLRGVDLQEGGDEM